MLPVLKQDPPFKQGLFSHLILGPVVVTDVVVVDLIVSHRLPVNWDVHTHTKPLPCLKHDPPFKHGLGEQAFGFGEIVLVVVVVEEFVDVSHLTPVHCAGHVQTKLLVVLKQDPPLKHGLGEQLFTPGEVVLVVVVVEFLSTPQVVPVH